MAPPPHSTPQEPIGTVREREREKMKVESRMGNKYYIYCV
jgi:hypothetical protein